MLVIYIAGAFRGDNAWVIHNNVLKAEQAMTELIGKGFAVICPHKMTENLQGLYPDQVFLDMCLEILARCDAVYFLSGWRQSEGASAEYKLAIELDKELLFEID